MKSDGSDLWSATTPMVEVDEELRTAPLHPRVLSRPIDENHFEWAFVLWSDPGGAPAVHASLLPLVEGVLLSLLSAPPPSDDLLHAMPVGLWLLSYADVPDLDRALLAFGFGRHDPDPEEKRSLESLVRGEAGLCGRSTKAGIASVWRAEVTHTDFAEQAAVTMHRAAPEEARFGAAPGQLFRLLCDVMEVSGHGALAPSLESLDFMAKALVPKTEGAVRWIPPRCFVALCDAVAVVAAKDLGREVAWAESEPDEHGLCPPPLIRVAMKEGHAHIPLGVELLRWLVMPLMKGEQVPPLSAWALDRIGSAHQG